MATEETINDLNSHRLSCLDGFFTGLQTSDMDGFKSDWANFKNEVMNCHSSGTLDFDTSELTIGFTYWMESLCDTFLNLEIKNEARAAAFSEQLAVSALMEKQRASPSTLAFSPLSKRAPRQPTPPASSSSSSLPAYIPPSYAWFLDNLHNPYPPQQIRQEIASSTNCEQRLIDAWFVDARRRIGWTILMAKERPSKATISPLSEDLSHFSSSSSVDPLRRPENTAGPGRFVLNYKTRKELVTAATAFFRRDDPAYKGDYQLSAEEEMHFSFMKSHAELLYKRQLEPSQLALKVTSQVKQWTPELGEQARNVRERERKRKRRSAASKVKAEPDFEVGLEAGDDESGNRHKRARSSPSLKSSPSRSPSLTLDEPVSSPSSSPSPPAYDSSAASSYSPSSSGSLKRKRAMSDTYPESEPPPISPAMKRFRTAMNSSGLSRSVSDPTSLISQVQRPQKPQEITFSGFQASVLDNWFGQSDLADPFGSNFDPFLGLDPVLSSDSTSTSVMTPLPFQPQPLSIDLADFSFSRSSSISLSSGYDSPSTSPSTPALSASGSLTDLSEDEDGGSSNIDSLFGDVKDGGAVSTISSYESIDGAVIKTPAKVEAKSCASVPTPAEILNNVLAVNGNNIPPPDFSAFELSISDPSLLNLPDFDLSGFPEINLGVDSQLGLQSGTTSEVGSFSNGTLASSMGGNYAEDLDTLFAAWSPRNDSGLEVGFREHWTDPAGPTPTMATFADASAA